MRPFDPRLLRRVPATRRHLALLGVFGVAAGILIISQATALAAALTAAWQGRLDTTALAAFVAIIVLRAGLTWAQGVVAARSAATVKAALRAELLGAVGARGPGWLSGQRAGEIATLAGRGLDALDNYFTGYLPQLIMGVTVPVAVLSRLVFADLTSAVTIAATLPLIPVFGALLGWQAQAATERQWRRLSMLGGHFLDMVAGLPTLRVFGRARAQVEVVRRMADGHRIATMKTLRIAFLSALALELVSTLSVALVAVPVGLRVLDGALTLQVALLLLLLAPEAYLPLRAAGARFHASMEGLTALDAAFTLSTVPTAPATDGPGTASTDPVPAGSVPAGLASAGVASAGASGSSARSRPSSGGGVTSRDTAAGGITDDGTVAGGVTLGGAVTGGIASGGAASRGAAVGGAASGGAALGGSASGGGGASIGGGISRGASADRAAVAEDGAVGALSGGARTSGSAAGGARGTGTGRFAATRPAPTAFDEIVFEDVTVAYDRTVALRDVSLTVTAGDRIAIVGPSGAGKSTLLGLLLGFVTPVSGRVLVDGVDLATIDPEQWRRRLAWVPQQAHLFATTMAGNIRLGAPDAPDADVAAAASAALLDDVIAGLPDGLDTRLGERGHGLSSGQRQRVALARAFLRADAPLLLLDEPTARLDGGSEAAVLDASRRLVTGRTALLVAHRPALLAEAGRILRIEDGHLTELPALVTT
ncbi:MULTISPECIES: ABC transporter ATP-binding protein/permease [Catenuloplanes]|uniref:ATP-binding cassette subfamily C protein CydD n=1 Tax=Catenuloplanes niger TaxID=587534 RepID=A0AAE4CV92_9ACTN|nr:ATP-binding cassette domain-containing protein [Catenuloplanes niger]MDR7324253.1 ATP-binding cassette subfamily C protein CydD [Catenuloplanes niger]